MPCLCPSKTLKTQAPRTAPIDQALTRPALHAKSEPTFWSPLTAGPYLVPLTRWIE